MLLFRRFSAARCVRGLWLVGAVLCSQAGMAKTFTVDTTVDLPDGNILDGICSYLEYPGLQPNTPTCSLRAAVTQANAISTADVPGVITIWLKPGESYYVGGPDDDEVSGRVGDLDVSRPMDIGAHSMFARAKVGRTDGDDRIFDIHSGAGGTRLRGMQLENSQPSLSGCVINARADAGALRIEDIELLDSDCSPHGAIALYNNPTAVVRSEIHHGGRAMWISGGIVSIDDSTIHSMHILPAIVATNNATAIIRNTTFSNNYKPLTANNSNLFVIGSTFVDSEAEHIAFKTSSPGQLMRINNSLLSTAGEPSCLFYESSQTMPVGDYEDFQGSVDVSGSVFDDASCIPNNNAPPVQNLYNASIAVTPLGHHGGRTRTHELLSDSDGIDWIPPQHCQANGTDQRGFPRAIAYSGMEPAHCDAGSTELQLVAPPPEGQIFGDGFED